ncbi:MAG: class I SAM-dependent methyltransferase [Pseudolabrys sp.]|nr:class I SAM-dependent methyltransferase [Pseudolabrys sp.]
MNDQTRCPGCGVAQAAVFKGAATSGPPVRFGAETVPAPGYTVWQCGRCALLFKDGTLSDRQLAAYYAAADVTKWGDGVNFPTDRAALELLRRLPRGARVLDYGCSNGRLLAQMRGELDCYGYEPNAAAAKLAGERGLHMISAAELADGDLTFDAIVLMDVFEHLRHPADRLAALFARLVPGGVMILATGNSDAPAFRRDPARFWYFATVEHLCALGRGYADYLCRLLPAELTHWQELSHYDTGLIDRAIQHLKSFAYYQFQQKTFAATFILPWMAGLRRARHWTAPPALTCTTDHVVLVLRKPVQGNRESAWRPIAPSPAGHWRPRSA